MKVTKIETYPARDNTPRWKVSLEGDDKPLILGNKPSFQEGYDILPSKLELRTKGDTQYYIWKLEGTQKSPKGYRRSPEDTAAIERQVILKAAVDLYCHVTESGKGFNKQELEKHYKACRELINKDKIGAMTKEAETKKSD